MWLKSLCNYSLLCQDRRTHGIQSDVERLTWLVALAVANHSHCVCNHMLLV